MTDVDFRIELPVFAGKRTNTNVITEGKVGARLIAIHDMLRDISRSGKDVTEIKIRRLRPDQIKTKNRVGRQGDKGFLLLKTPESGKREADIESKYFAGVKEIALIAD